MSNRELAKSLLDQISDAKLLYVIPYLQGVTYLAVLEPGEDGSYGISFPALPGCFSYGENLAYAGQMAAEAALIDYLQIPMPGRQ